MNQEAIQPGTGKAAKVCNEQSPLQQGESLATTTYKPAADAENKFHEVYRNVWDCRTNL